MEGRGDDTVLSWTARRERGRVKKDERWLCAKAGVREVLQGCVVERRKKIKVENDERRKSVTEEE